MRPKVGRFTWGRPGPGSAWAHFDVYMPDRWTDDLPRRRIPVGLEFAAKPQLAMRQLERLADADAAWTCRVAA